MCGLEIFTAYNICVHPQFNLYSTPTKNKRNGHVWYYMVGFPLGFDLFFHEDGDMISCISIIPSIGVLYLTQPHPTPLLKMV